MYAGQFDWGGLLLKSNGGAQRSVQCGWKPHVRVQEHKPALLRDIQVKQSRKRALVIRQFCVEGLSLNG